MDLRRSASKLVLAVFAAATPLLGHAACDVRSGPRTAALIELYTSEGCSSCPPADRMLMSLSQTLESHAEVVPLALHVSYWDYIGWKDRYAQDSLSERQAALVRANRQQTVYTPQFFIGGSELGPWRTRLQDRVRQVNAMPAAADIRLRARITSASVPLLHLDVDARTLEPNSSAVLYLALAESGLETRVTRGENSGATLAHDHVVRAWIGPIHLKVGRVQLRRELPLPAAWDRAQLEAIAFVQDESNGEILQALRARKCIAS